MYMYVSAYIIIDTYHLLAMW